MPDVVRDGGHGAHLHDRGARPDRAPHEDDRRVHGAAFECELRVRVRAQLPADDQPRGRDRVRAQGAGRRGRAPRTCTTSSRRWAPRTSATSCRRKPGCYFLIGNGDGAHRVGGHGMGPCMLHNPSYDFNDDLIPLGATVWVRLAEKWLRKALEPVARAGRGMSATSASGRDAFSQTYAEASEKFLAAGEAPGSMSQSHVHPLLGRDGETLAMDVARDGPPNAERAADPHQRLPRRRRLLRLGRAGVAAGRCGVARGGAAPPAWRCCSCTRSTPTASRGGGAPRTRTSTSTATSTTSASRCRATRATTRSRRLLRAARPGRPRPRCRPRSSATSQSTARRHSRRRSRGPARASRWPVLRRPRPDLEQP